MQIFTKKVVQFILVALVLIILSAFILGTLADSSWVKGTGSGPGRYIQVYRSFYFTFLNTYVS